MDRSKEIIKTSCVGIAGNIVLSAFKFAVGIIANSVSIRMDALNNLADAMSSVITIVGTRLAEKEPDRKHPFGYGRTEHLTSLFIGILILYAGLGAIRESVMRIIHPEPSDYSAKAMLIVAAAVVVKILLGLYTRKRGEQLESAALTASGKEALIDALTSSMTLIAALLYVYADIKVEAYVGVFISLLIIRTGLETIRDTADSILGERADKDLVTAVKRVIRSFPEVEGVFDLIIHNYGREKLIGSAGIEISDDFTAAWIDNLQRSISQKVKEETGVEMLGITIFAVNSTDEETVRIRDTIRKMAAENKDILGIHGFYIDKVDMDIKFHVVTDYDCKAATSVAEELRERVGKMYPDYNISVLAEKDFAD